MEEETNCHFCKVTRVILAVLPILWFGAKKLFNNPKSVKEKVVLVTGSANGIGRSMAKKFAALGSKVVCVDLDHEANEKVVKEINLMHPSAAKAYRCNVGVGEDIKTLYYNVQRDFGNVDILVNNAAVSYHTCSPAENDEERARTTIEVNLLGDILMVNEFLPSMLERNEGHIAAVSSMSIFLGGKQFAVYAATKSGIRSFIENLRLQLDDIPNNKIKTTTAFPCFVDSQHWYAERLKHRITPMPADDAADAIINGILKNQRETFVGLPFYGFLRFLPQSLLRIIVKKLLPTLTPLTETENRLTSLNMCLSQNNGKKATNKYSQIK